MVIYHKMPSEINPLRLNAHVRKYERLPNSHADLCSYLTDLDDIDEIKTEMELENEIEKEPDTHSPPKQAKSKHDKNIKSKNKGKKMQSANRKQLTD